VPSRPVWSRTSRVPSSVLLHLWAKFRIQTKGIIADKGLGNWDDERLWHVKFRRSRTSGTPLADCLVYLPRLGLLDRQMGFGLPLH
jgi:hypothetical protein